MTISQAIEKVINVASEEVGYLEKASNNQLDSKTANAGSANYTKYWAKIKPEYQGQPWCACFVTWCFVQAFGKAAAAKLLKHYPYVYCPTMANLFTLNSNPKRGDIIIFKRRGTFVHTGIVTSVNGDYFTTIEGNTSGGSSIVANGGGVFKKGYYNSNLPGTKFCTPDWSLVANVVNNNTNTITIIKSEPFDAYGIINASSLNVRNAPISGDIIASFVRNDKVHIIGALNGWFEVEIYNNTTGFISGAYVSNITTSEYTSINDIVDCLNIYGIVQDTDGMKSEMNDNPNGRLYWLGRKLCIALHSLGGKAKSVNITEYTSVNDIIADLALRRIIYNSGENIASAIYEMNDNPNGRLYWLARKGLTYLRERD